MNAAASKTIILPTALFVLVISVISAWDIDLRLADCLFALEGSQWSLKNAWLTKELIHEQGRSLIGVILLSLLTCIVLSYRIERLRAVRQGLYYLLVSALISVAIVNLLKAITGVDCPWDLSRYGGTQSYVPLLTALPEGQRAGACFPAGHASGAYCWIGIFFVAGLYRPRWRYHALAAVLSLGFIFGTAQQLRGAHFLSHDIWTLYICWMSACFCYYYIFRLHQSAHCPNKLAGEN